MAIKTFEFRCVEKKTLKNMHILNFFQIGKSRKLHEELLRCQH